MHEYSIVQALLNRVEEEARSRGATAVHRLAVRIGEQSGVDPAFVAAAWEICRDGTICAGAALDVETVAARWVCPKCGRAIARGAPLSCAACGAPARLAEGDEILLARIDMEVT